MTTIFSDGFESGDFSNWTAVHYYPTVQSSVKHSGTYAERSQTSTSAMNQVSKVFTSQNTVYLEYYLYVTALPYGTDGFFSLGNISAGDSVSQGGNGSLVYLWIYTPDGGTTRQFQLNYHTANGGDAIIASGITPQINTWYKIGMYVKVGSGSGEVKFWINDNLIGQATGLNNSTYGNADRVYVGQYWYNGNANGADIYSDDVTVTDTPPVGTASKLEYIAGASQTVTTGSISSVITVQVQDSNGNPVTTGATVNLSTTSTGGSFYSDSGGSNQITSIVVSSGQSSGNFYYKDTTAGTPTLTASSTGLTSATTQFTINQSGSQFITIIASGAPFTVSNGALSLNTSSPMQVSNNTLTVQQASATTNGYLSSTDWNTFNNKQNALTTGNLNGTANQVNVSGGSGAIIGSGVTLSLPQNIHTGASPTFAGLTVNGNAEVTNVNVTSGLTLNGSAGNSGQVLTSNGQGNAPTWQIVSEGSGSWNGGIVTSDVNISGASLQVNGITVVNSSRALSNLTADAGIITSGAFSTDRIPSLDAAKITTGIFGVSRVPDLAASKITSGTLDTARVPSLDASKITTGTFADARVPNLDASKITTGTLSMARLPSNIVTTGSSVSFTEITVSGTASLFGIIPVGGSLTISGAVATAVNSIDDGLGNATFYAKNRFVETMPTWISSTNPDNDQVLAMFMGHDFDAPDEDGHTNIGSIIQFWDSISGSYTALFAGLVSNGTATAPALVTSHQLLARKDIIARGKLSSYEGDVVLKGGLWNNEGINEPICGWGPTSRNPFIQLADLSYATLEIVKYNNGWQYAGLKCDTIYVDNIKHTDGSNWNFGTSIQKGSITTNASGLASVTFPQAFGSTPSITCTAVDPSGRSIAIVITAQSATQFSIKTTATGDHKHKVGDIFGTEAFGLSVDSVGDHTHSFSAGAHTHMIGTISATTGWTMGIDSQGSHNHTVVGTTGVGGAHNHTVVGQTGTGSAHYHNMQSHTHGMSGISTNTGTTQSHTHTYYVVSGWTTTGPSNNSTTDESSHTHYYSGYSSDVDNHTHNYSGYSGDNGSHSHNLTNKAAYTRSLMLRDSGGSQHDLGGLLTNTSDNQFDLYTLSSGGGGGTTGSAGGHTHNLSGKPAYTRGVSLRNSSGGSFTIGGVLANDSVVGTTEAHTETTSPVSNISITVNWIAVG